MSWDGSFALQEECSRWWREQGRDRTGGRPENEETASVRSFPTDILSFEDKV